MTAGGTIADDSWAFALRLYARPGIAQACLRLQAEAGVDVMMMIVAVFAISQRNIPLTPADIEAIDALCRPWREGVVHPLRALRTALKDGPAPAPSAQTERLRGQIKAGELAAERLENDLVANWLQRKNTAEAKLGRAKLADIIGYIAGRAGGSQVAALAAAIDAVAVAADG